MTYHGASSGRVLRAGAGWNGASKRVEMILHLFHIQDRRWLSVQTRLATVREALKTGCLRTEKLISPVELHQTAESSG